MALKLGDVSLGRENNIDFWRLCLATAVIWSHSYPLLFGNNDREPFLLATGGQRTCGDLAVDGFFILSGFLIARSWTSSRGLGDYLRRRAFRIYPGFLMAVAVSGLIAGPLLHRSPAAYWKNFPWRAFLIGGANLSFVEPIKSVSINASLWSIRYEFLCYLAVAGLGLCGILSRRRFVAFAFLACMSVYAGQIYFNLRLPGSRLSWLYCSPDSWPRLMSDFLAGVLFYCYRDRIVLSWPLVIGTVMGLLAVGVVAPSLQALPLAVPVLGGYVLFFASYLPMGRLQHVARRGDLSYGLYLYAYPIQLLLVKAFQPWLNPLSLFLIALAVTAVFAAASWRFVESPFLRLKRSSRPSQDRPELAIEPPHAPAPAEPLTPTAPSEEV
ncbi:MAG: acyltransferase [Paludisphaera borealis]|uniref:acyltransferase family protein n=1 Tax=Paludisphaera borealis TaxID=1387353 RepID=UPI0028436D76|nr:acyltransferase [Paludisphaera borealis]MDR3622910.1 acyltransferase [Paludisphaera borealis]